MKEPIEKLDWEEIILNIGKPVYDKKHKKWRVLEGYSKVEDDYYILFSDNTTWFDFKYCNLYLKEVE